MNGKQNKLKVMLVDHRVVLREGMHSILESEEDVEVVAEGTTAEEALGLLQSYPADVVVMNPADAEGVLPQLRERFPAMRLVLVGEGDQDRPAHHGNPGAEACLSRDMKPEELVRAVGGLGRNGSVAGLLESKESLRDYLLSLVDAL